MQVGGPLCAVIVSRSASALNEAFAHVMLPWGELESYYLFASSRANFHPVKILLLKAARFWIHGLRFKNLKLILDFYEKKLVFALLRYSGAFQYFSGRYPRN